MPLGILGGLASYCLYFRSFSSEGVESKQDKSRFNLVALKRPLHICYILIGDDSEKLPKVPGRLVYDFGRGAKYFTMIERVLKFIGWTRCVVRTKMKNKTVN